MEKDEQEKRNLGEAILQITIVGIGFVCAFFILYRAYWSGVIGVFDMYSEEDSYSKMTSSLLSSKAPKTTTTDHEPTDSSELSDESIQVLPQYDEEPTVVEEESVNINTADREELDTLPGIGPTLAERIIQYRKQNGPFTYIEQLKSVSGIGNKTFERLREYITVE